MTGPFLPVLLVMAAYLLGAIPGVRLIERVWNQRLRSVGTGNIGAGNATRQLGLRAGVALAVLDGLKGLIPVVVGRALGQPDLVLALAGLAAVAGNNWPMVRSDRGGRGLATSVGVVVGFAPILMLWPLGWALIGWAIGGGLAGFVGWGLLPAFTMVVRPGTAALVVSLGLALEMIVRRAQGNAGFVATDALRRVLFDEDPRPTVDPRRWDFRGIGVGAVVLVVGAPLVYVLILETFDVTIVWTPLMVMLLLGAILTEFAAKWAFGELFREGTIRQGTPISRAAAFRAAMVATGVARLLPAGGAVTPAAMAWSVSNEARGTSGAGVRATVLNYGGLAAATGAGLVWVGVRYPAAASVALTPIGVGLGLLGLSLIAFGGKLGMLRSIVPKRFRERLESVFVDHGVTLRSWVLLTARVGLEAATLGFTLTAFDVRLRPSEVIAVFGISQLIGGLPGLPGGLGITEAGLLGALAVFGVPAATAATPIVVFRVISYWLPALGGAVAGGGRFVRRQRLEEAELEGVAEAY